MDVPLLSPLPLPEGHGAQDNAVANNNAIPFLIQQYFIEGVCVCVSYPSVTAVVF